MANGVLANRKSTDIEGFIEVLEQIMNDGKETKTAPFEEYEVKSEDSDFGIVEGYASVFGKRDHGRDMVMPGAFTKSLQERSKYVVYIPSHNYGIHVKDIPAVPVSIKEDSKGLHTTTKFFLNTQAGRDSFTVIKEYQKAGRPLGLSYTYKVYDYDQTSDGRNLKELGLHEYGHTALPMLDEARTVSTKADSNSAFHSAEIDHAHNHGDMIHSHMHKHTTDGSYYNAGHYGHDHTEEQLKSLVYNSKKDYSKEQRDKMAKSGEARPDGSYPIADEEDLSDAIHTWGLGGATAADKTHIIKRARALGKYSMIPDNWKSIMDGLISCDIDYLLKDFEIQVGGKIDVKTIAEAKNAITILQDILGQSSSTPNVEDTDARMRQEIEEMLARITI